MTVEVEDVDANAALDEWVDASLETMRRSTGRMFIIDAEPVELKAVPGWRLLVHSVIEEVGSVTMERRAYLHRGQGWVVSAAADTLDYWKHAAVMEEVTCGFRLLVEDP